MILRKRRKETFKVSAPEAKSVRLAGTFTNWEKGAIIMNKATSGEWVAQVTLEPGAYEYKFVADGIWLNDKHADRQIANDHGSQNSVRLVR